MIQKIEKLKKKTKMHDINRQRTISKLRTNDNENENKSDIGQAYKTD